MNIKEELDIEDVCFLDTTDRYFLSEAQSRAQYNVIDVKLEKDPADLSEASTQNCLSDDIGQEINIKSPTILDFTNGIFIHENQYPNIKIEENSADLHKTEIKCSICHLKFRSSFHLKRHSVLHSNERPFECGICLAKFKLERALKLHSLTHSDKYDFGCNICNRKFKFKNSLRLHSMSHKNKRPFKCATCTATFNAKGDLTKHLVTHSDKHDFECDICHNRYKRKKDLNKHLVTHSDIYNFNCEICHTKFQRKDVLKSHLTTHLCKYECGICHKKFKLKSSLKSHLKTHLDEYNFRRKCNTNGYSKMHLRSHSIAKVKNKEIKKKLVIVLRNCLHKTVK